jgi:hypothetical protein
MTPMTDVVTAGAARYAGQRINRVEDARSRAPVYT